MKGETRPGETVGGLMTAVLLFGVLFALLRPQSRTLVDLLILVAILLSLRWAVLPIWVVSRQRVTADPSIEPFDPDAEETPEQVRSSNSALTPKLHELGFALLGHLHRDSPGLRGLIYATILVNTRARQTARLCTVIVHNPRAPRVETFLIFRTDFTDGTRMITSNNKTRTIGPHPARNREGSMSFPEIRDISVLHQIHEGAIARYASDGLRKLPELVDLLSYLRSSTKEEHEGWLESGYYFLDEQEQAYRPTWKGAVLMGLRISPPIKWMREHVRRWRVNRLLKELEIAM
jgi:hypothetical protein